MLKATLLVNTFPFASECYQFGLFDFNKLALTSSKPAEVNLHSSSYDHDFLKEVWCSCDFHKYHSIYLELQTILRD
jgi:hypothetical protein